MLTIYTSESKAKELSTLEIAPDIETRFNLRSVDLDNMFYDENSVKILKCIEGMTSRLENGYMIGKFGSVHLSNISTGGKGLLLAVNYKDEFMINIDELGYNCIYLLFELTKQLDIQVVSTRVLYHMLPEFRAKVNNVMAEGSKISKEMEKMVWDCSEIMSFT